MIPLSPGDRDIVQRGKTGSQTRGGCNAGFTGVLQILQILSDWYSVLLITENEEVVNSLTIGEKAMEIVLCCRL